MFYRKREIRKTLGDMEISEGGVVKRLRGDEKTLRELRDFGIVIDARVDRVRETGEGSAVCLKVGDRRVDLNDLLAGSVEVTVPCVYTETRPEAGARDWRLHYLMISR